MKKIIQERIIKTEEQLLSETDRTNKLCEVSDFAGTMQSDFV